MLRRQTTKTTCSTRRVKTRSRRRRRCIRSDSVSPGRPDGKGRTAKIAVIAGDGIGPEVIEAAIPILDRVAAKHGFSLAWERLPYSADHFLKTGETLPDAAFQHLRDDVA